MGLRGGVGLKKRHMRSWVLTDAPGAAVYGAVKVRFVSRNEKGTKEGRRKGQGRDDDEAAHPNTQYLIPCTHGYWWGDGKVRGASLRCDEKVRVLAAHL
jgi:hypothetical protein